MRYLLLILFCSASALAQASDAPYAVSLIPESLKKDAHLVKRMEDIRFTIISTSQSLLRYKYALTILNENGDPYAGLTEYYDKLRQVSSIEGNLYDAEGKLIRRLKSKEVLDLSAVDDVSLIDDNRRKVHHFYHKVYPYTVEYEVEVKYNNTFSIPSWFPQEHEQQGVEQSTYTLITPRDYTVRYRMHNYKGEPAQTTDKDRKVYTWQVKGLTPIKREFAAPRWHELTTVVSMAPTEFEIEGYKGNMATWKDFGLFMTTLKKDRDQLPEAVKQTVQKLTAGLKDDREKVKVLYHYLQQNTRYISIQLGLGGWQPFPAAYVAQKGYGDCKALSNYMYSLLKEADIRSSYALIKAGSGDDMVMHDFPSNQFNHAILCVPMQKDTIWLECTDQSVPAGYMGAFTGNRKALLIDESGGTVVSTVRYGLNENTQKRTISAVLDERGTLQAKVITNYKAIQQDYLSGMVEHLSGDKVKEVLNEELGLSSYQVNSFKYNQKKEAVPEIDEELDLMVNNFATVSGKRMFITPNLLNKASTKLTEDTSRKYGLEFRLEYRDVDTVMINIPTGYKVESIAQDVNLKTKFGSYSASMKFADNKITYIRTREQYAGKYVVKDYSELVKYFNAIYKADRNRIVLVKE
jgi:hypothetical protein